MTGFCDLTKTASMANYFYKGTAIPAMKMAACCGHIPRKSIYGFSARLEVDPAGRRAFKGSTNEPARQRAVRPIWRPEAQAGSASYGLPPSGEWPTFGILYFLLFVFNSLPVFQPVPQLGIVGLILLVLAISLAPFRCSPAMSGICMPSCKTISIPPFHLLAQNFRRQTFRPPIRSSH